MNPQEQVAVSSNQQTSSPQPIKIGKFKASRMLVRESLNVLKQDKELAWFPVLTAIVSLIALVIFVAIFFYVIMGGDANAFDEAGEQTMSAVGYGVILIYYIVMFFIANYFLAGVYTIVHARFNGQNLSLREGIDNANKHISKIFVWSVISATVGVVLRIISDKSEWIGKIVAGLFGAAWAILTYFSLPALIIGQKTIKESFKESAATIRKTWGEAIIVNFGISLFFTVLTFVVMAFMIGIFVLVPVLEIAILLITLFVIYICVLSIISSTLGSIVKLALYEYATNGNIPQGFTPEIIRGMIRVVVKK